MHRRQSLASDSIWWLFCVDVVFRGQILWQMFHFIYRRRMWADPQMNAESQHLRLGFNSIEQVFFLHLKRCNSNNNKTRNCRTRAQFIFNCEWLRPNWGGQWTHSSNSSHFKRNTAKPLDHWIRRFYLRQNHCGHSDDCTTENDSPPNQSKRSQSTRKYSAQNTSAVEFALRFSMEMLGAVFRERNRTEQRRKVVKIEFDADNTCSDAVCVRTAKSKVGLVYVAHRYSTATHNRERKKREKKVIQPN